MIFTGAYITVVGANAIASSIAGTQLIVTSVAVGSGIAAGLTPGTKANITTLASQKMTLGSVQTTANNLGPGIVGVLCVLDTANAPTTQFNLTEVGVFAKLGAAGTPFLLAYYPCQTPGDVIVQQTGLSRIQSNIELLINVGVGANVAITVVAGNPVFIPPVKSPKNTIAVTTPLDTSGNILEWDIDIPTIVNSTTLFVAAGNNNVAPNFSTLQNALNYLDGFVIPNGVQITISVAPQQFDSSSTIFINHVNGQRIVISGQQLPDVTFTGIGAITGSAGNWNVALTGCSSTANISASATAPTRLNVFFIGGTTNASVITGFFPVVAVSGSTVTINVQYGGSTFPSMAGSTGGAFSPINTIFRFNAAVGGIFISGGGLGGLYNVGVISNITLSGTINVTGIEAVAPSNFNRVGVRNWQNGTINTSGFAFANNQIYLDHCSASNNGVGLISFGNASVLATTAAFTNNSCIGLWCQGGQFVSENGIVYLAGNGFILGSSTPGGNAAQISANSVLTCQAAYINNTLTHGFYYVVFNAGPGVSVSYASIVDQSTANEYILANNNGILLTGTKYDAVVDIFSFVPSAAIQGSRIFNVTVGTMSPTGGLIA